ncbi:hypothetical protein XI05_01405 [Bradyrhizobium sp. CCBAU 11357]|nr:hypothetical protein [Bradyrhizobium sp. CCBAU 11357]
MANNWLPMLRPNVRIGSNSDISALFDHFVSEVGGTAMPSVFAVVIDHQSEFACLLGWKIAGLLALTYVARPHGIG